MASCFEGMGEPLRVAGWKCQLSSATKTRSSSLGPRLCRTLLDCLGRNLSPLVDGDFDHHVSFRVRKFPGIGDRIGSCDRQRGSYFLAIKLSASKGSVGEPGLSTVAQGRERLRLRVV